MKSEKDSVVAIFNNSENSETVTIDISVLDTEKSPETLFSKDSITTKDM